MKRLMTSTAIIAALATSAFAQTQTTDGGLFSPTDPEQMVESQDGFVTTYADQMFVTDLLGMSVYNSTAEDAERIGDINDIILAPDGRTEAVIIGVGGFLGIGEKEVAIAVSDLHMVDFMDTERLVSERSKEELEAAPAFERPEMRVSTANDLPGMDQDPANTLAPADPMDGTVPPATDVQPMDPATQYSQADIEAMPTVPIDTIGVEELLGAPVRSTTGETIGNVGDVILTADQTVAAYVIDVGGFLGIGEKPVAINTADLTISQTPEGDLLVRTGLTAEQLNAAEEYTPSA